MAEIGAVKAMVARYNRAKGNDEGAIWPDLCAASSPSRPLLFLHCRCRCFTKWELAQGYILKAIVGHGRRPEWKDLFREMEANIQQNKKLEVPAPKPDADSLEKIIAVCSDCQLFADAFEAIEEMKKTDKKPGNQTLIKLHQDIVKMIEDMQKEGYRNVRFRGIDVNDANLAQERRLLEDLKKQ